MSDESGILNKFIDAALKTGATIEIISNRQESITGSIKKITDEVNNVACADLDKLNEMLGESFIESGGFNVSPTLDELASADIGISYAFAGIARTGTIAIRIDTGKAGYVSLLPTKHVAILEIENIVSRPKEIFTDEFVTGLTEHNGVVFISGPSATADMGELVRGAHGPAELHIILIAAAEEEEEK